MEYIKISKSKAGKLWADHKDFLMCANNLRPDVCGVTVDKDYIDRVGGLDFDHMVNTFAYYNCINSETGRRVAFYVKAE